MPAPLPLAASFLLLAAPCAAAQLQMTSLGGADPRGPLGDPARNPHPGAFSDQTLLAGIDASLGPMTLFIAGGAVGDFDRDGFQDFFYPAGLNGPDKLYINDGDGTFSDRASDWGVDTLQPSSAAAVADYDGDGWLDIYVTTHGATNGPTGPHRLYRNTGTGSFVDMAVAAGVDRTSEDPDGWGACFGDYDLDGDLDLVVTALIAGDGNVLFRNDGDGTFTDVTSSAGLGTAALVRGFAPRFADMDGDRYPELIWIGDLSTSRYYANDGDGTFSDVTNSSGTSLDTTEMGMTVADWDEDGDFDFYVTTIGSNNLYINQGQHFYVNVAPLAGVELTGTGWGTVGIDFNHDSLLDIVATSQGADPQYAFRNVASGGRGLAFHECALQIGLGEGIDGRGLSNLDYDNDGDQDLLFFPHTGPVKLYRNDVDGPRANWLRVFLDRGSETAIAPDGIGSVVEIDLGTRTLIARIDGGSNYLSQSELSAHFGLGEVDAADELRVRWTNGTTTTLSDVGANQTLVVSP